MIELVKKNNTINVVSQPSKNIGLTTNNNNVELTTEEENIQLQEEKNHINFTTPKAIVGDSPVKSVNGKIGHVELTAADVGALPADTVIPDTTGLATTEYVDKEIATEEKSRISADNALANSISVATAAAEKAIERVANSIPDTSGLATKEYVDEEISKIETGGGVDLTGYATEQFVIQQVSGIDLSEYATKEEIPSLDGYAKTADIPSLEGYAKKTDIPSLEGYAQKGDIPSIEGLATETYVGLAVAAAQPDLTPYAKKTDIPDTSGLATETYVNQKIAEIPDPDLSAYAKKTDIPSHEGLATEDYVDGEISTVMNVASGKTATYIFETVAELDADLAKPDFIAKLNKGDVFLIKALNVPDYWWDGEGKSILETTKCDLKDYAKTADVPGIKVNNAVSADTAATANNSLTVGGYTLVISNTPPTNASDKTITFVIGG